MSRFKLEPIVKITQTSQGGWPADGGGNADEAPANDSPDDGDGDDDDGGIVFQAD